MITIFHNPICRKSREGLSLLEESGKTFEVRKYLENNLTVKELNEIVTKLDIKPGALIRTNEKIWKDNFKGKDLTDEELLKAMVEHPKLIERPIVVNGNEAVVGRPSELIKTII